MGRAPGLAGVLRPLPAAQVPQQLHGRHRHGDHAHPAEAMAKYQKLGEPERRWAVGRSYKGNLRRVLALLPASDQVSTFAAPLMEIGRFVEETASLATAGMSEEKIAAEEAKFLTQQAADEAAKKSGGAPPTPAQVEEARKEQVESTSIAPGSTTWWIRSRPPSRRTGSGAGTRQSLPSSATPRRTIRN